MLLKNSFEGGTNNAAITVANSGGASGTAFTDVSTDPAPVYSDEAAAHGNLSAKFAASTDGWLSWIGLVSGTGDRWGRAYIWAGQGGEQTAVLVFEDPQFVTYTVSITIIDDDAHLELIGWDDERDVVDQDIVAWPREQWVRVELHVNNATRSLEARIYFDSDSNTPDVTLSGVTTQQAGAWNDYYLYVAAEGAALFADDVAVSDEGWIGPEAPPGEHHSGGASATVTVGATGGGTISTRGGAPVTVTVSTAGAGRPATSGGASALVTVAVAGAGAPGAAGGSPAAVAVAAAGAGMPAAASGSTATVAVTAMGGGQRSGNSGGASATVTISAAGAGAPILSGGAPAHVVVAATAAGVPEIAGGSAVAVTVAAAGAGTPQAAGGSTASVAVEAVGGGRRGDVAGGSTATVTISAVGGGMAAFAGGSAAIVSTATAAAGVPQVSGGSSTTVAVAARGGGFRLLVDITVAIGPTRVRERVAIGPTRPSASVGLTRINRGA